MQKVLIGEREAEKFSRMGFLRKKLLGADAVSTLTGLYHQYFPDGSKDFYSSTFLSDITAKKELSDRLVQELDPVIRESFQDYKILGAQFLIKNPGDGGLLPFHQDWTIVDEEKHRSVTVWISLNEANEQNGTIKVIPYSHEFSSAKRGPGNFDALADIQNVLEKYSHSLSMEAGEAFIFDQAIVHGSGINSTELPRIAVAFGLVHKDAELVFYHRAANDTFEQYQVPDDFFITFPNDGSAPPEGKLLGIVSQDFTRVSLDDFIKGIEVTSCNQMKKFTPTPLFRDVEVQQKFDRDGFVRIPLLNEKEVDELKDYYLSLHHDHIKDYGFHISLENNSEDYRNGIFKKLFETIMPKLDPLLVNYKTFTASYVIKEAGLQNIVPPHQDWNFVDETEFCSATVWIPLMDVNKNNGALGVIPGSHRIFNYPRASPSPQAKSLLSDHVFNLFPYVKVVEMKAGEALIFNNKTIHASPPNISGLSRIAAGIGITHEEAQLRHYYQQPGIEEKIEVYEVDSSFFPHYNNARMSSMYDKGEKPKELKKIEHLYKIAPNYSKEEITELVLSGPGVVYNGDLMHELAEMYNYNLDGTSKEKKKEEGGGATIAVKKPGFFKVYTPSNILAEIKHRMSKKPID